MRMYRLGVAALCAAGLLSSVGCVMPDQLNDMQKDLDDVRRELREIQDQQADARESLDALQSRTSDGGDAVKRSDLADVVVDVERVAREVGIADERLNDLNRRFDRLSQEVRQTKEISLSSATWGAAAGAAAQDPGATPGETAGETPGGNRGAVPDAEALYNTAYADFSKGNYALAISGFDEYVDKFPDSPLADNALYWVGECHFSQGNFPEAIETFDRLLERFPRSDKAAAGNLKKALAYLEQNQIGQAIVQLRFVMSSYPGSDEARIARDKLTSLGAPV